MNPLVQTTTRTKTSVGTYLMVGAVGAASFAAAMFYAMGQTTPATLAIGTTQQAGKTNVVIGTHDVNFLTFGMVAGGQNVIVDSLSFDVIVDTDGDLATIDNLVDPGDFIGDCDLQLPDGTVVAADDTYASGRYSFDDFKLAKRTPITLHLVCETQDDYSNAFPEPVIAFSLTDDTNVIASEESDGDALLPENISVGQNDSGVNLNGTNKYVALVERGAVNIARNPDFYGTTDIVLPSSTAIAGEWLISALGEPIAVSGINFKLEDLSSITSVWSATLTLDNGTEVIEQTNHLENGVTVFYVDELEEFLITPGTPAVATLTFETSTTADGVSGSKIRFGFDGMADNAFNVRGVISGHEFAEEMVGTKIAGQNTHVYAMTKPILSLSPLSPSGIMLPGNAEVFRFNAAADAAGDIELSQLTFQVTTTDNTATNWNGCLATDPNAMQLADFSVYNLTTSGLTTPLDTSNLQWTFKNTEGEPCTTATDTLGYATVSFPIAQTIPAGQTYTYAVYIDTTGASSVQDDSIRLELPDHGADITPLLWDDGSGQRINGALVELLPVTGGTITF